MLYGNIPGIGEHVSRIFYGTSMFSSGKDADELLDAVTGMGINALDTARVYGHSEEVIGRWMKLETSLKMLGTDDIDILVLHRDDPSVDVAEIVETCSALIREGKIRAYGGSNWTHERIAQANAYAQSHGLMPFSVSSPNFSLARQVVDPWGGNCVSISGKEGEEARAWYRETQLPVISYSSLAHGFLSGRVLGEDETSGARVLDRFAVKGFDWPENYARLRCCEAIARKRGVTVPQVAIAWLFQQGIQAFAVIASSSPERMRQNAEALKIVLTEEENAALNGAADM